MRLKTRINPLRLPVLAAFVVLLNSFYLHTVYGEHQETETGQTQSALKGALRSAIQNLEERDDIRIDVACSTEAGSGVLQLFGQGVGIWNREKQFQVSREQVNQVLQEFRDSGFTEWRELYGGSEQLKAGVKIICRAGLSIGSASKTVFQRERGKQFEPLRTLSARIFALTKGSESDGVRAESLDDGLEKLASGELNPVTFQLLLHRRFAQRAPVNDERGWILRVEGLRVTHNKAKEKGGYSDPSEFVMSEKEFSGLVQTLHESGLEGFPLNLFADSYTELSVQVLNREKSVLARQFSRITHETRGEQQVSFDRILALLTELKWRVGSSPEKRK